MSELLRRLTPGGDAGGWLRRQLFDRRIVLVSGTLDDVAAGELSAAVMTLDALGDDPVQLQFDNTDGSTAAALAVMDVIDLCGVPVRGVGVGRLAGPMVGVFAVCSHRILSPHAQLWLQEPRVEAEGDATRLERLARAHLDQWSAFCARVAAASGRTEDWIRDSAAFGQFISAADAVELRLADELAGPEAGVLRLPGRRLGFGSGGT